MIPASVIVYSFLSVVVRQALAGNATEVSKVLPLPFDGPAYVLTGPAANPDVTNITLKMDAVTYQKNGITNGGFLLHKVAADASVGLSGCVAWPSTTTDQICQCSSITYNPTSGAAVTMPGTNFVTAAGLGTGGAAGVAGSAVNLGLPITVWQTFCANQYAKANTLCVSAATNPCNTVTISAGGTSNNASLAPGSITVAPAGNGTTPKAGASMTTSQVTVLTIGPLAMLAVANFVV